MVSAAPLPRPFPAIGRPARTIDFIIPFSVNPSEAPRAPSESRLTHRRKFFVRCYPMSGEKSAPAAPPPPGNQDAFRFLKDMHVRVVDEPLIPGSAFYEPLHEGNIQDDPVARMFTSIAFTPVQSIQLFSGFSGSGKATELLRLKQRLEQAGFVVVYANALDRPRRRVRRRRIQCRRRRRSPACQPECPPP